MSKKLSTVLISIALLIVLGVTASVVSYSIANKKNTDAVENTLAENDINRYGDSSSTAITHIDLIIKAAIDKKESFNVVEIVPNGTYGTQPDGTVSSSYLQKYITDENFSAHVITENRSTETRDMPTGKIAYTCIEVSDSVTPATKIGSTTVGEIIDAADLIYLHSPSASAYNDNNDFHNDLYDKLKVFIDKKPTIIDFIKSDASSNSLITYQDLMYEIRKNYIKYRTYPWESGVTAKDFLAANGSYYIKKSVSKSDKYLSDFFVDSSGNAYVKGDTSATAAIEYSKDEYIRASGRVLVLSKTGSNGIISQSLETYKSNAKNEAYDALDNQKPTDMTFEYYSVTGNTVDQVVDKISKTEEIPIGYVDEPVLDASGNVTTDGDGNPITNSVLKTMTRDMYDFIILEEDLKDVEIDSKIYSRLRQLSESSKYILFPGNVVKNYTPGTTQTNNYIQLMNKVVSSTGKELSKNVLPLLSNEMEKLANQPEDNKDLAKKIADIINYGTYRDSDKTNGKKYRVLEIEPCYPIDLDLAVATNAREGTTTVNRSTRTASSNDNIKGDYYYNPGNVYENYTKEMAENEDYYAFDFTKAKVAYATGHDYDDIEVTQMSTNQLISSKDILVESYDMVYIGANNSANVPFFAANFAGANNNGTTSGMWQSRGSVVNGITAADTGFELKFLTVFDTYTHTGIFTNYPSELRAFNIVGSNSGDNSVTFNGNDINSIKLEELKNYVDSGLPIIIDGSLTSLYDNIKGKSRLEQLKNFHLDPDSYMYDFLSFVDSKKGNSNVSWGKVNAHTDIQSGIDNSAHKYGSTDTITVLGDTSKDAVSTLYTATKDIRPTLLLNSFPTEYIQGNSKCVNTTPLVAVKGYISKNAVKGHKYRFDLYADTDGDGFYGNLKYNGENIDDTSGECKATKTITASVSGETSAVELSFDLEAGFFGLVNWKVIVTDLTNNILCDYQSGCAFYNISTSKKPVRILQIMPETNIDTATYTSAYSLYLCPECQASSHRIKYNAMTDSDNMDFIARSASSNRSTVFKNELPVGMHQHDFGIVKYVGSAVGDDDWETNYADILTHGDDGTLESGQYEFTLDILSPDEFEKLCADAKTRSTSTSEFNSSVAAYYSDIADYYRETYPLSLANDGSSHDIELNIIKGNVETLLSDRGFNTPALSGISYEDAEKTLRKCLFQLAEDMTKIKSTKQLTYFGDIIIENIGTEADPGQWMIDRKYHRVWFYLNEKASNTTDFLGNGLNSDGCENNYHTRTHFNSLKTAYSNYVAINDRILMAETMQREFSRKKGNGAEWLTNNYDMVVLGFADRFGSDQDLDEDSCDQINKYVNDGGFILNTHDSLSLNKESQSVTMANKLRETFGMDRFHVTAADYSTNATLTTSVPDEKSVELSCDVPKNTTFRIGMYYDWCNKEFTVTDKNVTIHLNGGSNTWDAVNSGATTITEGDAISGGTVKITVDVSNAPYFQSNPVNLFRVSKGSTVESEITTVDNKGEIQVLLDLDTTQSKNYGTVKVTNKDLNVDVTSGTATSTEGSVHSLLSDKLTINVKTDPNKNITLKDGSEVYTVKADASGNAVFSAANNSGISQGSKDVSYNFEVGANNVEYTWNLDDNTVSANDLGSAATGTYVVNVKASRGGVALQDGELVICTFRGTTYSATVTGGVATFNLDTTVKTDNSSLFVAGGDKYKKYNTKAPDDVISKNRNANYFWTVRVQATEDSTAGYKAAYGNDSIIKYNAPLGLTDTYSAPDSISNRTSPYRYAGLNYEYYEKYKADTDGAGTYEAKYGTRIAQRTNESGLTKYPYEISSDPDITATHAQAFALDMEDPNIAVFYTLGGNRLSSTPKVESVDSKKASSMYAASPRDGMNNYFMYYRVVGGGRMFYTGAGHQKITGKNKNNNDERKLFINVILSSVVKGTQSISLKLYNKSDKAGNGDEEYVNPGDTAGNKTLAEKKNTLYYNKAIGMYQYNVEEDGTDIYPEFDFKAIAGTDKINKIEVFYDLDYGTKAPLMVSDEYKSNANHVLIASYDDKTDMNGQRVRLRDTNSALLLKKDDYTKNYKDYTYIVIRVTDEGKNVASARIKINYVAHLFDLTDAGFDYQSRGLTTQSFLIDITDRKQFNI